MAKKKYTDREELRQMIVEVTEKAFAQHGIRNVHMDGIAELLSISKRTIYEIFKDKEELLKAVFLYHRDRLHGSMAKVMETTDNMLEVMYTFYELKINEMANVNPLFFRDLRKFPDVYAFMREEHRKGHQGAMEIFKKGVEQGIFRSDVNYDLLLQFLEMQMDLLVYSDISEKYPLEEIFIEFTNLNMRGILTPRGSMLFNNMLHRKNEYSV